MYQNGKNISFTDRSVGSVNSFLKSISTSKPLTTEEENDLWLRMQKGCWQARQELIKANLPFVVAIAKRYYGSKAAFEDLIMAGCEGIVIAVDKFDATRGNRFITYAKWYIENEIRNTAYDYMRHDIISLDEAIDTNDEHGTARVDHLASCASEAPDWGLRYNDSLAHVKSCANKRLYGSGELIADLHNMLQNGYTISDFARKHYLNDQKLTIILNILQEEISALTTAH